VFDHRAARNECQRLARKAARLKSRWNEGDDGNSAKGRCQRLGKNYGHGKS
jgi:hypothetical protein